jgi:hypothetical protein
MPLVPFSTPTVTLTLTLASESFPISVNPLAKRKEKKSEKKTETLTLFFYSSPSFYPHLHPHLFIRFLVSIRSTFRSALNVTLSNRTLWTSKKKNDRPPSPSSACTKRGIPPMSISSSRSISVSAAACSLLSGFFDPVQGDGRGWDLVVGVS